MNESLNIQSRLLSAAEAAKFLGISVSALNSLRRRGILPYVRLISDYRYDVAELCRLIEREQQCHSSGIGFEGESA